MAPKVRKRVVSRPVHMETTIPVVRPCGSCGVWFAAGVAEGMKAEVEFVPLDIGQQLWAALNHVELYCIRRSGLVHMDARRLAGKHYGSLYPQHRCSITWPQVHGHFERPVASDIPPF